MKLRILHILCYLCLLCMLVQPDEIGWENQTISTNPSNLSSFHEAKELLNINSTRDKRALGLILSGLAQVFGYTVNPVQIASLTNPNVEIDEARAPQPAANGNQTPSASVSSSNFSQSNNSSSTATPRQRETIRFTGVLNFGNNTGLLSHLQEYERIFHGGDNSSSSTTSQSSLMSSTTQLPQMNMKTPSSNQPMPPPLLVKIPLPVVSELPLPAVPQSPLPEIPSQDIMLSYPEPLFPVRQVQQTEYRKNENIEKMTVENKQIFNGMEAQSPPPSTTYTPSTEDPRWKKEYEERLMELERKQAEQAERFRQQEWYRNRQKEDNYSGEENDKQHGGREKPVGYGGQDFRCRDGEKGSLKNNQSMEEEDRSSVERYESEERNREYSTSERPAEFEEGVEETEKERYRDNYNNDNDFKYKDYEDTPQISENYTNPKYSEPLPLSEDDEHRRPGELRNSYGELLHNRELFDDAFADYFGKLKQPLTNLYSPSVPADSKNVASKEESPDEEQEEHENGSSRRVQEEDDTPAWNKYEEYSLEEDADTKRGGGKGSNEEAEDTGTKYLNVLTDGKNRSYSEEKESMKSVDFGKYMPLVVPIRYLSAPEELRKVSHTMTDKLERDNNVLRAEAVTKVSSKDMRSSRKDNLKPTILFSERKIPRRLYEGEQKELQAWPPPFDFVVDSTIHTNVVPARSIDDDNIRLSNSRPRLESSRRGKEEIEQEREKRVITDNVKYKLHGSPENVSYENFKKAMELRTISGMESTLNVPLNTKRSNRVRIEDDKFDRNNQRNEMSDFRERYKHGSNHNYRSTENPNIAIQRFMEEEDGDSLYAKRLDTLERSIDKPESIESEYYAETYPVENKAEMIGKNDGSRDTLVRGQMSKAVTVFVPSAQHNYFDFGENTYGLNYGTEKTKLSEIFADNKETANGDSLSLTIPQSDVYRYDESVTKFTSEPESKDVKVRDRDSANGAITDKQEEMQRRNELEHKMAEILENLKTRLLVE